jgi:hypothetical protein
MCHSHDLAVLHMHKPVLYTYMRRDLEVLHIYTPVLYTYMRRDLTYLHMYHVVLYTYMRRDLVVLYTYMRRDLDLPVAEHGVAVHDEEVGDHSARVLHPHPLLDLVGVGILHGQ